MEINLRKKFLKPNINNPLCFVKSKVIFFRVTKVAGASITKITDVRLSKGKKITVKEAISPEYNSFFKFAFVRNPWDRLVSCYKNKENLQRVKMFVQDPKALDLDKLSFYDFAHIICRIPDESSDPHFRSMHSSLYHNDVCGPKFIGRFENLQEDWEKLWYILKEKFNWTKKNPDILPTINKTEHRHYSRYYNNELRDLVGDRYAKDIELFDYSFK
jgi:hypothetical protein